MNAENRGTSPTAQRSLRWDLLQAPRYARYGAVALALAFTLAHVPFLPQSLEDIDSVNFALGIRDFDVAKHQPHPPGYPVYIVLAKMVVRIGSFFVSNSEDSSRSRLEARAMAVLSLVGAALLIFCTYRLLCCFSSAGDDRLQRPWRAFDVRALAATALAAACPLFWYLAVRPMSDVPGLAAALAADVCFALAWWRQQPRARGDRRMQPAETAASGRMIVLGSFLAAIAIGFRSQSAVLTVPLLLTVMFDRIGRGVAGALIGGSVAFAVGVLLWAVPLLIVSGGWTAYLAALGTQAGDDFAGVEMLYLNPTARVAVNALLRTFIYPWDSLVLGSAIALFAVIGLGMLAYRDRRTLIAVIAVAGPYLVFHLLFHDMNFVRYALPLMPFIAYLAVRGLEILPGPAPILVSGGLAIWGVMIASPMLLAYAAEPSPVVRALGAIGNERSRGEDDDHVVLAMHQTFQRPLEAEVVPITEQLLSPPRREWLELTRYWRQHPASPVWFLADPRRTDLALIDPASRSDRRDFGWRFSSLSQIGGMRPAAVNWYRLAPPGWFAEEGWALTPETAGIAESMQRGPYLAPIAAWIRRRETATRLLIGGRHLGAVSDPAVTFVVSIDGKAFTTWEERPGFFLRVFELPSGTLSGAGPLAKLEVRSTAPDGARIATAIEQFDLQQAGSLMWGFGEGWHEAEYNPRVGLWRWASERATLRIVGNDRPVAIRMQIESPLRYFDDSPHVTLTAAGQVLARVQPTDEMILDATVSSDQLRASGGAVVLETDRTFVPAERGGPPDRRHLGLRVFGVSVAIRN